MIFVLSGCGIETEEVDTENQLTPITNTGARTFSCKINGEVWKASKEGILGSRTYKYAVLYRHSDSLVIYADRSSSSNQTLDTNSYFYFDIIPVQKTGEYVLDSTFSVRYCFKHNDKYTCLGTNENFNRVLIIITLDTTKRIVSGIFEFRLQKPDGTILNVTDGRFDLALEIVD